MKLIRDIQNRDLSKLLMPAIAVLFVFSLSFHNHAFGNHTDISFDSHTSSSHSVEDCSACLLQGNLQVPQIEYSFDNNHLGQLITYTSIDLVVPNSFINFYKPSRAPPSV